jgi:hypothetical protein
MTSTRFRKLGTFLITLFVVTMLIVPANALAKKNQKKKKGKKDKAAEVEAETPEQKEAREHYSKGKALYDEGEFEAALFEFSAAYEIKPHPTVLKSIAECEVQMGDIGGAIDTLQEYVDSPEATDKEAVEARINELKNLPVKVAISSQPEGAKISVAGTEIAEVTPATIELAAGEYVVTLSVDGSPPVSKSVVVKTGQKNELSVDFAAETGAVKPAAEDAIVDPFAEEETAAAPEVPMLEEEDENKLPNAFWASVAVAGVGLVSGTVFGTMALADEKDYEDNPTQSKKDAGERDAIIADVSFGVAGAAAIVGTVILVTSLRKDKKQGESARVHVLPVSGRHAVGMSAAVSF